MGTHLKRYQLGKRSIPYLIILFFSSAAGYLAAQNNGTGVMNQVQKTYNISSLDWKLWGFSPESFRTSQFIPNPKRNSEIRGIPATVPGSVQMALKNAGIIKDWKPRFYYVWDWMPRNVQIGIWDDIQLIISDKDIVRIENLKVLSQADKTKEIGELKLSAEMDYSAIKGKLSVQLKDVEGNLIINEMVPCTRIRDGKVWNNLKIKRWWPNGQGDQTLYQLVCTLYDETGAFRQEIRQYERLFHCRGIGT